MLQLAGQETAHDDSGNIDRGQYAVAGNIAGIVTSTSEHSVNLLAKEGGVAEEVSKDGMVIIPFANLTRSEWVRANNLRRELGFDELEF